MSAKTVANYAQHRASRGLPPTLPPPPMAKDVRAKAKEIRDQAERNLAVANELDEMANAMEARER